MEVVNASKLKDKIGLKIKINIMIKEVKVGCLHKALDGCDNCSYNIDPYCVLRSFHCDDLKKALK